MKTFKEFLNESKKFMRGDSIHNKKLNKTAIIASVAGSKYTVITPNGKEVWDHKDVELVEEYD